MEEIKKKVTEEPEFEWDKPQCDAVTTNASARRELLVMLAKELGKLAMVAGVAILLAWFGWMRWELAGIIGLVCYTKAVDKHGMVRLLLNEQ